MQWLQSLFPAWARPCARNAQKLTWAWICPRTASNRRSWDRPDTDSTRMVNIHVRVCAWAHVFLCSRFFFLERATPL